LEYEQVAVIPRLFEYQRLELLTLIDNSPKQDLLINTHTFRWFIRDLIKHPRFIFSSLFSTKRFTITGVSLSDLPIQIELRNQEGSLWVSRKSFEMGVFPSSLDESLEYDRLRNPSQFNVLVRSVQSNFGFNRFKLYEESNFSFYLGNQDSSTSFQLEFEEFEESEIVHGKVAISDSRILSVSNVRKELIRRSPRYVHQVGEELTVLRTFREKDKIENAVFFGSNLNWFHFIVECLTRYTAIPLNLSTGIPIILEFGVHPNIIEICKILSGAQPILVGPLEKIRVETLWLAREIGVGDAIDSSPREHALLDIRERIFSELGVTKREINPTEKYFFRRRKNLFRPLQNEDQLLEKLSKLGFILIFPEDLKLIELIEILHKAEIVVVESGAAMTNLMFAPSGLNVIELNPGDGGFGFWQKFLNPYGLLHHGIVGKRSRLGNKGLAVDGFKVDVGTVLKIVESVGRQPINNFVCENPRV